MYVCLCNGFTDRDVRREAATRNSSVSEVYRALGCAPRCGKCVPMVCEMLKAALSPADEAAAVA